MEPTVSGGTDLMPLADFFYQFDLCVRKFTIIYWMVYSIS
jgi:hypothetical protein